MKTDFEYMNDLEAVDNYIEQCKQFVNPRLLGDIQRRGLYHIINFLPTDIKEAKSVARARMAKAGKCFGDAEIDAIANTIKTLEKHLQELNKLSMTDCHKVIDILDKMQHHAEYVRDYFKLVKID